MDSNERVNLVVGEKKQLPFDISEAGPGNIVLYYSLMMKRIKK